MATSQRFIIAAYNTGLQNNIKPFMIPEEAFAKLQNMYVWRSRVRKRVGSSFLFGTSSSNDQLYSRLRIKLNSTDGSGNQTGTIPGAVPLTNFGQMFSIGSQIFTVDDFGTPRTMLNTGIGTGTFNTTTGAYVFTGVTASTDIYYYPAQPVMGFGILNTNTVNFDRYIGFDTQFAYEYKANGGWERLDVGAATWTGNDSDFFYSCSYRGADVNDLVMFTTNFNTTTGSDGDGIRYFDGTTWTQFTQSWSSSPNTAILNARIIIQFKGRLLLFNTWEQPGSATRVNYQSRVRYSATGNPIATDAWYNVVGGVYSKGGSLDAPTQEIIISAQILKDRMIVYFERSTWELVYTNNEILPFRWQNINIELGSESTFSLVPFDRGIIGIGEVGIHVTNGINVQRIDTKIPDQVYDIQNMNNGTERVQGIRDYDAELVYWAIPSVDSSNPNLIYPNQVLVYNYVNDSWSLWDDSITAFGYINLNNAVTWSQLDTITWQEWNTPWGAGQNQARQIRVMAGNQEGFTFYMSRDISRNAPSRQITKLALLTGQIQFTVINHNFTVGDWVLLENITGTGNLSSLNGKIFQIALVFDVNTFNITLHEENPPIIYSGTYSGAGTIAEVNNIDILTKQYNFFLEQGRSFSIDQINFLVERTPTPPAEQMGGQVTIATFPNSGVYDTANFILETSPYDSIYYPYEQFQDVLWHSIYPNVQGAFIQLGILWSDEQMIDPNISLEDFTFHAMLFYTSLTSDRLQ